MHIMKAVGARVHDKGTKDITILQVRASQMKLGSNVIAKAHVADMKRFSGLMTRLM